MVPVNKLDWDKPGGLDSIMAFTHAWLRECRRVLSPNATIWVSGTHHNIFIVGCPELTVRRLEWREAVQPPWSAGARRLTRRYWNIPCGNIPVPANALVGRGRRCISNAPERSGRRPMFLICIFCSENRICNSFSCPWVAYGHEGL